MEGQHENSTKPWARTGKGQNRQRRTGQSPNQKKEKYDDIDHVMRHRTAQVDKSAKTARKSSVLTERTHILRTETIGGLEPENDLERTLQIRQAQIRTHVDMATAAKSSFHLDLASSNLTPYTCATYSRSGRSLLIASRKGHVAMSNWRNVTLQCEMHLNETIRSATFLHNDGFFATAQKDHAFIYDTSGAQVHALRQHTEPGTIVSLPHHLLLATVSAPNTPRSQIVYTDTSTGEVAAHHNFASPKLALSGSPTATVNLSNGVLHVGHNSGTVSMWAPNAARPLARVFCHAGGVRHVGVMSSGTAMVTVGADGILKVTDMRTFKTRLSWRVPAMPTALALSQRQLIALSFGATVQVWAMPGSNAASFAQLERNEPYMTETFSGKRITGLDFCPFEDVLAVCHHDGMFSMLVPGCGEPNFDTSAPNPYETKKQRRENEVRSLLDKLPASMIALDPSFIGSVDVDPEERLKEIRDRERAANVDKLRNKRVKNKMKGRSKISKVVKRKENNVIDARRLELQDQAEQEKKTRDLAEKLKAADDKAVAAGTSTGRIGGGSIPDALSRFLPKA